MATIDHLPKCHFEEINIARNDPNVLVIDVRETLEIREVGHIPGTINIPREISAALGPETSNEKFIEKHSVDKPHVNHLIIFTCRSGRRSGIAQQEALNLGYKYVKNYIGGWLDWEQQINNND